MSDERDDAPEAELMSHDAAPLADSDELPVVARLVVEIRSDGRRTIARGAIEDRALGQSVAIEAKGDSPVALAMALARSMLKLPSLGRTTARALLPGRRGLFKKR